MKKIFLLAIAAAISFGSIAQGNSNNNHNNHKHQKGKKSKDRVHNDGRARNDDWRNRDDDRRDRDDDRRHRDDRNGDWRTGRDDGRYDNGRNDQSNAGRAPRKVTDAFQRDYPNASNVTWTKDRGVWSARFKRSGIFGGNTTVSYRANGERVSNNNLVYSR